MLPLAHPWVGQYQRAGHGPRGHQDGLILAIWKPSQGFAGNLGFPGMSQCCVWEEEREGSCTATEHMEGLEGSTSRGVGSSVSSRNQHPGFVTREEPSMGMELQESTAGLSHSSRKGLQRI